MTFTARTRLACVALVPIAALGLAACSGSSKKVAVSATSSSQLPTSPVPKTTVKAAPTTKPAGLTTNPLTGTGGVPSGPVIAVKIDDTENGRPQVGIDQADIVYIEQAEAGLTRLVAVYASHRPVVEAVRSVRAGDFELLPQYGPIDIVASGGGGDGLQAMDASGLKSSINDRGGPGFSRDGNRSAPYNLQSDLMSVAQTLKGAGVKNVGFTWSAASPLVTAGTVANDVQTMVGQTNVEFRYDPASRKYIRYIDGERQNAADGAPVATSNVIVQFCRVEERPQDVDVNGVVSRYTYTTGTGTVAIFRNGRRINGTWSRATKTSPITFKTTAGAVIPLAPGGAWFALSQIGAPLTAS